jgi:hypothetical protein
MRGFFNEGVVMNKKSHYVPFDLIRKTKLSELGKKLESYIVDIPAMDISIGELCRPKTIPNGVYLFYDKNKILWYVGKATSRSFVERIPAHFDLRYKAWFNAMPKKMCSEGATDAIYEKARQKGLSFRLVMVGMDCSTDEGKMNAGALENVLRYYLEPKLNVLKRPALACDGADKIKDILAALRKS